MKESDTESVANHVDPESCVFGREVGRGACAGTVLSREIGFTSGRFNVARVGSILSSRRKPHRPEEFSPTTINRLFRSRRWKSEVDAIFRARRRQQ